MFKLATKAIKVEVDLWVIVAIAQLLIDCFSS